MVRTMEPHRFVCLVFCLSTSLVPGRLTAAEGEWQIGLARTRITPEGPFPMAGYGPRVSKGVLDELHAKALAIKGPNGRTGLLITADLLFFRAPVAEAIARRITQRTGLARADLLLSASHTHAGPILGMTEDLNSFEVPQELRPRVEWFARRLEDQLGDLAVAALGGLQPARLSGGRGQADFVMNRRLNTAKGVIMAPNPHGPVDRDVPVLRVEDPKGRLRALVFGCACHPVTLSGDNFLLSGDYAGLAQQETERRRPGVQAMFVFGCGGDANTQPRGSAELAKKQGEALAAEVLRVAAQPLKPLRGPLRTDLAWTELPLEHSWSRARWQEIAAGPSWWHARTAKTLLQRLDRKEPLPRAYLAPIALWQFGTDLTLVGLPGEGVAEYAAKIRSRLGKDDVWTASCCNESFGYLPTPEILKEGGHESMGLTLEAGLFAPQVEETVLAKVQELARPLPDSVVFPGRQWCAFSPVEAGLNKEKLDRLLATVQIGPGSFGGVPAGEKEWGAVLVRGGYLVRPWGNPSFQCQSASLGKCLMRALFGLTVEAGLLKPDEPIWKSWTGRGQLSHPHKYLDEGLHRQLTWRQLLEHQGGFVLESGYHWRRQTVFHASVPEGVRWTGDPLFDNFAHTVPGSTTRYASAGYWRLSQALTALWGRDLKEVLDDRLFRHLDLPAERWDWLPGQAVHDSRDFYPDFPGYGEYVDPPYKIGGTVVRGGPGWVKMSAEDLARFGFLIATGVVWKGRRVVGSEWLRGHAGLDIHVVAGDPATLVAIAKINTKGFPFGLEVGTQGRFSFPRDLVVGPVRSVPSGK
jgi:CubicO group peptidase (beta-lactamase class C family)